jgi:hypothetical protein
VRWAKRVGGAEHVCTYTTVDNVASANALIAEGFRLWLPDSPWFDGHVLYWRKGLA